MACTKPWKMPRQIVINVKYGGFHLSDEAKEKYKEATELVDRPKYWYFHSDVRRDDPILIRIITEMGLEKAAGYYAKLKIIEIPDDVPEDGWEIMDYDGIEWVAEKHRTWQ